MLQKSITSYKPEFYGKSKIIPILIKNYFTNQSMRKLIKLHSDFNIKEIIKLRKKLLLSKLVKFDGRYYSTPSIPGFPSNAYKNMISLGGLNFNKAGSKSKRNMESAFLAITNRCQFNCMHCYEKHNINNHSDISIDKWQSIIDKLQHKGVNIIILTGGEPLLRYKELLQLLKNSNKDLSDFHLHTSGFSLTSKKAKELKSAGLSAAAVGLENYIRKEHENIRGKNTFNIAVNALRIFNEVGILTYTNLCLTKNILSGDNLYNYYEFCKELNVSMIQILEPRPCGGYFLNPNNFLMDGIDRNVVLDFVKECGTNRKYSNYPILYYVSHIESPNALGCNMGGLSLIYIDSHGNVNPCVFLPVSFGNILKEDFNDILAKMRKAVPHSIKKECPSLLLADTIKRDFLSTDKMPVKFQNIEDEWTRILIDKIN